MQLSRFCVVGYEYMDTYVLPPEEMLWLVS